MNRIPPEATPLVVRAINALPLTADEIGLLATCGRMLLDFYLTRPELTPYPVRYALAFAIPRYCGADSDALAIAAALREETIAANHADRAVLVRECAALSLAESVARLDAWYASPLMRHPITLPETVATMAASHQRTVADWAGDTLERTFDDDATHP